MQGKMTLICNNHMGLNNTSHKNKTSNKIQEIKQKSFHHVHLVTRNKYSCCLYLMLCCVILYLKARNHISNGSMVFFHKAVRTNRLNTLFKWQDRKEEVASFNYFLPTTWVYLRPATCLLTKEKWRVNFFDSPPLLTIK